MNDDQKTDIALIKQDVGYIRDEMRSLNNTVTHSYVSLEAFNALKNRVDLFHRTAAYFLVIVGVTIVGAVLKVVLK